MNYALSPSPAPLASQLGETGTRPGVLGDLPLCRMDMVTHQSLTLDDFKPFDYWFRRIL